MNPKYEKGIFCSQMQQIFVLKSSKFTKKTIVRSFRNLQGSFLCVVFIWRMASHLPNGRHTLAILYKGQNKTTRNGQYSFYLSPPNTVPHNLLKVK